MDRKLLLTAVNFWCPTTNSLILPLGPMSPTVLDITALLGRSLARFPIDVELHSYQNNIELKTIFDERAAEVLNEGTLRHNGLGKT